jgi:hypothetical protein
MTDHMSLWAEPEPDLGRLHSLSNGSQYLGPQMVQVNLVLDRVAKSGHGFFGIVFGPIQAPVNELLEAAAHG